MKRLAVALLVVVGCKKPEAPPPPSFAALDLIYAARKEPLPPAACRRVEDAEALAKSANDVQALRGIAKSSPEAAFLLAHAVFDASNTRAPELDTALTCPGFAAALHLHGNGREQACQPRLQGRQALAGGGLKAPLPLGFLRVLGLHHGGEARQIRTHRRSCCDRAAES